MDHHPGPRRHRRTLRTLLVVAAVVVAGGGLVLAAGFALLTAANPVGDEWQCSQGEAPAHTPGGGSACFEEGSDLPRGYAWDRFGNRPLASNCDKDGWTLVEDAAGRRQDCVREGTALPTGWHPAAR